MAKAFASQCLAAESTAPIRMAPGLCACTFYRGVSLPRARGTGSAIAKQRSTVVVTRSAGNQATDLPPIFDTEKEESRQYRRTAFTHNDWFKHRSTTRYKRHMLGLIESRIFRGLSGPVAGVVGIAAFVSVYETLRENGVLPPYCIRLAVETSQPFSLTSFALSLLLVFRTNASYARWDDARRLWGGVVNRSRDVVRQGMTWIDPEKAALRAMLVRWVAAFPFALKCHLTYKADFAKDLEGILEPHELEALLSAEHKPTYVQRVITDIVYSAKLNPTENFLMDGNMTFYSDVCGSMERILTSPIPLSWTRHTSRFLVIWIAMLPFLLYSSCRWATVPVSAVISFLLLGIEDIGVQIEEPFSILPLDGISNKIKNVVFEIYDKVDSVNGLVSDVAASDQANLSSGQTNNGTGVGADPEALVEANLNKWNNWRRQ